MDIFSSKGITYIKKHLGYLSYQGWQAERFLSPFDINFLNWKQPSLHPSEIVLAPLN